MLSKNMKAFNKPLGEHSIAQCTISVATFLRLEKPEQYTSHSYKHSAATLIADNNGSTMQLKNAGGWKSEKVAEGYVQKSTRTKKRAAELIGLFDNNIPKLSPTTKKKPSDEKTSQDKSSGVTNVFNFNGDTSSIRIGDFCFGAADADRNTSKINYNKPYGSYTVNGGEGEIIQLPDSWEKKQDEK
jgi:hypothetical protein